jgi:hypothetical protein
MKTILSISGWSMVGVLAAFGLGAGVGLAPQRAKACGDYTSLTKSLDQFARDAVSDSPHVAAKAIKYLRAAGQPGLDALFRVHEQEIAVLRLPFAVPSTDQSNESHARLKAALEAVSQQRDCEASKLYWYTDIEQAKAAAAAAGNKPILSLRLLGKLNEEYSCANSRFFRTTLYANSEVAAYLRDHFILHWQSVRPVPRITVDFGDGRKIERTITGNSIHYILDSKGRVVDALPGLYGARAFLAGLQKAETAARTSCGMNEEARIAALRNYHNSSAARIQAAFILDLDHVQPGNREPVLGSLGLNGSLSKLQSAKANGTPAQPPSAAEAATRTASKTAIERPLLRPGAKPAPGARPGSERIENDLSDETWQKIAALHADDATLDQGSRMLIRAKSPNARKAMLAAVDKRLVEDPLLRSMRNLERSTAEDTVRNEYTMHTRIHQWLAERPSVQLDQLNSKVYAELFLTPDSDPWLGLVPADTYSALENDGLILSAAGSQTPR